MLKKIQKYLFIISPVLILISLFNYYLSGKFGLLSLITLIVGLGGGIIFFVLYYEEVVRKITKRKVKYGFNSAIITIVVLALVVIVYLVTIDKNKKFDLTAEKRFTLSEQTQKILSRLNGPVNAYAFYSKQMDKRSVSDLLGQYHYLDKDFNFEVVDPDLNPGIVEKMGVKEYGELLIKYGGKTEKAKSANEEGITNALIKLSQTSVKKVYFIKGHGEKSIEDYGNNGYDRISQAIKAENFEVDQILLLRAEKVPDDCSVLIAAGPKNDYEQHEIDLIDQYVQSGGRVLFLLDPDEGQNHLNKIALLLEKYGLLLGNDVIIDPLSRVLSGDYFMPVINDYTYSPITKNFSLATFLRVARSIGVKDSPGKNIMTRIVARTGESSWAETNVRDLFQKQKAKFDKGIDQKGPVSIMAYATITLKDQKSAAASSKASEGTDTASDKNKEAIVLAIGDSDFISNSMYQTQGNKDLFLNTLNYLSDRGELISVRPKQQESVYLTMTAKQGRTAFFITVLLIPLFVIAIGIYTTVQRRVRS